MVRKPWIGVFHHSFSRALATKSMQQSMLWCKCLIVFSREAAQYLRKQLPAVRVLTKRYPLETSESYGHFDLQDFTQRRELWKVAIWGQGRQALSTLAQLRVKYPKVWLPLDNCSTHALNGTSELPGHDYEVVSRSDELLLNNIVVVDVPEAASCMAVLEAAILMAAPIFVRRDAAMVAYLGADYPFYFGDLEEIERILDSTDELSQKMRTAHEHLKGLSQKDFSIEKMFAADLNQILLEKYDLEFKPDASPRCAQARRHPDTCTRILAYDGCAQQDEADCSDLGASTCASFCMHHKGCSGFVLWTKAKGCVLCSESSESTSFLPLAEYHLMSCWREHVIPRGKHRDHQDRKSVV